ncbi:MAG: TlpA disulfide reductase family protein [Anaerolineae bacterium]|nr:TlpA family protein disulfide reductase [Thermoflexales bacterium]MDW8406774.1 TlpA disulfide reductase family protein [Anaerolineae bacterium]
MVFRKGVLIGVAVLAVLAVAALFAAGMVLSAQSGKRPTVGSPAPDFVMPLYEGYRAGFPETIRLADLRGKVVVLNFWASWCVECVKETDALEAVWREYKDRGLIVLGVDHLDTEAAARKYLADFGVTFPNGIDLQQQVSRAYRITGVPETFFIDKQGVVRKVVIQALSRAELIAEIEPLLAE